MKKTAVQWLIDELEKYELYSKISYRCLNEIEIALEMEKEQIINSFIEGAYGGDNISGEQYYEQTYGGNK
jgi:hypothetical protein